MKKLFILLLISCFSLIAKSQSPIGDSLPIKQSVANATTTQLQTNALKVTGGLQFGFFVDTAAANASITKCKFYPNAIVTTLSGVHKRNITATKWERLAFISDSWSLTGNSSTDTGNFIGNTDNKSLYFRVNNDPAGIIYSTPAVDPINAPGGGIAMGHLSGENLIKGVKLGNFPKFSNNTLYGYSSGRNLGVDWGVTGKPLSNQNTYLGLWAGNWTQITNGGAGQYGRNVGVGESALYRNVSGSDNTAVGSFALEANDNGDLNTAFGRDVLRSSISGSYNTGIGQLALGYNTTGVSSCTITNGGSGYTTATVTFSPPFGGASPGICFQTATGTAVIDGGVITGIIITNPGCAYSTSRNWWWTLYQYPENTVTITGDGVGATATVNISSGNYNIGVGLSSGFYAKMPQECIYIGMEAGISSRWKDTGNIIFGRRADIDASVPTTTNINKSIAIGYNAKVSASNTMVIGGTGVDAVKVAIGRTSTTYGLDVADDNGAMIDSVKIKSLGLWSGTILWPDSTHPVTNPQSSLAVGINALDNATNSTGFTTAIGYKTMEFTGAAHYHNTAVGTFALRNIQSDGNVAIGAHSQANKVIGMANTTIGAWSAYSLRNVGTNGTSLNYITAIGFAALGASNSAGQYTTVTGAYSGSSIVGGSFNTAYGAYSLGSGSGINTNPLGGSSTLYGSGNTAIGFASLIRTGTSSTDNIAIGRDAAQNIQGNRNIYLGAYSGISQSSGHYNVIIGSNNGASINGYSRQMILSDGEGNERMRLDSIGQVGIGTTTPTEKLHVVGKLKIVDGFQANGYVYTCDANGVGTWQAPSYSPVVGWSDYQGLTATQIGATYSTPNDGVTRIYNISAKVGITAVSGGTIITTVDYTDETNTARTVTFYSMGTTTAGLTTTGVSGFPVLGEVVCYPNSSITVTSTLSGGTATYNFNSTISFVRIIAN